MSISFFRSFRIEVSGHSKHLNLVGFRLHDKVYILSWIIPQNTLILQVSGYMTWHIFLVMSFRIDSMNASKFVARCSLQDIVCWEAPTDSFGGESIAAGVGQCRTAWRVHGCLEVTTSLAHTGRHMHLAHQCCHRRCVLRWALFLARCLWRLVWVGGAVWGSLVKWVHQYTYMVYLLS